jgi:hypothetical protein
MMQAARIAKRAADRVEDQIGNAPLPQAVVTFGVMTDKISLLSNDPQQINITQNLEPGPNLYAKLEQLAHQLNAQVKPCQVVEFSPTQAAVASLPNQTIEVDAHGESPAAE